MERATNFLILTAITIPLCFGGSSALAKGPGGAHGGGVGHDGGTPSGFSKGSKEGWKGGNTPPGWSKGKKKGWQDAKMPPGLAKKSEGTAKAKAGKKKGDRED